MNGTGAYEADRASALAGVPESTLYLWARQGLIRPTVSPEKVKLWSWSDLVAARAVYWLRHPQAREHRRATTMNQVKSLLKYLADLVTSEAVGNALWEAEVRLFVDPTGIPHVRKNARVTEGMHGFLQAEIPELSVDLLAEFQGDAGAIGPDLRRPSRHIRIVPGVLSGEPHIEHTRIDTRSIDGLRRRGFTVEQIVELYPATTATQVHEAIALERRLTTNERSLAA